ncbi:MAG: ABC transporter ATP-binding protein, partial [Erysipelotrichaceae bacterium]|nr:ABC transporter ATP-binding protein [Erysipelotrichaceae bacterium]
MVNKYFAGLKQNASEQKRYAKQKAKYEKLVARGKTPEWKVVEPVIFDEKLGLNNISVLIQNLINNYETDKIFNAEEKMVSLIDYFKEQASNLVNKITRKTAKAKALKLLDEVGIPEPTMRYNQYPFELSGGMRQRIVIAIALAADPDILICDEPTTALDVTIQGQILDLINKLKRERDLSVIFITHNLGVVANMADRIAVMYAGKIVEEGTADEVFYDPRHPYTWA